MQVNSIRVSNKSNLVYLRTLQKHIMMEDLVINKCNSQLKNKITTHMICIKQIWVLVVMLVVA